MFKFIAPEVVRIDLGYGDYIDVKRELTSGEAYAMRTAGFQYVAGNPEQADDEVKVGIDWGKLRRARLLTYIVDWNAKDAKAKPIQWGASAVDQLSQEEFTRLDNAVLRHIDEVEQEKKQKAGVSASAATPSPAT